MPVSGRIEKANGRKGEKTTYNHGLAAPPVHLTPAFKQIWVRLPCVDGDSRRIHEEGGGERDCEQSEHKSRARSDLDNI